MHFLNLSEGILSLLVWHKYHNEAGNSLGGSDYNRGITMQVPAVLPFVCCRELSIVRFDVYNLNHYMRSFSGRKDTFSVFVCVHVYASSVSHHLCLKLASVFNLKKTEDLVVFNSCIGLSSKHQAELVSIKLIAFVLYNWDIFLYNPLRKRRLTQFPQHWISVSLLSIFHCWSW